MSELTTRVRAKHPGAYDDMDDATLEKAVLAKYPEYADLAKPQPAAPAQTTRSTADLQAANAANTDRTDMPSTMGFLGNVASSGGKFVKDSVMGAVGLAKGFAQMGINPEASAHALNAGLKNAPSAIAKGIGDRYGGVDQVLGTAYHDPVGMASDISTVAGGVGLGAKAAGASKIARAANAVSEATNPMSAIGAVAERAAHGAANATVRTTLRPPAAVRDEFGGSKAIADAVLGDKAFSEASAQRKLTASVKEADDLLAAEQAAGTRGVPRRDIARAPLGEPLDTAKDRLRVGNKGAQTDIDALKDKHRDIFKNNPHEIPLVDAQRLKRGAQDLAFEAGKDNLAVKKAAEQAVASALKDGIEARVPAVAPINERSQRLIGVQKAFNAAEDRPRALANFLTVMSGGLAGPIVKGLDSPRLGAVAGIGMDTFGKGMNAASLRKAALLARLAAEEEPPAQ